MAQRVLVVDDRTRSAQALIDVHALEGCEVAIAASWVEAADTLAYQQLANAPAPALVVGPLSKDAIDSLASLRRQGIDPAVALYTENRSHDQDTTLIRQYGLRAILHKPFAPADRARLFGAEAGAIELAPLGAEAPTARDQATDVALPPPAAARTRMRTPPMGTGAPASSDFDDLIGSNRTSSVREQPVKRPAQGAELPTGVQRLLKDYGAEVPLPGERAAAQAPAAASPSEPDAPRRLEEPRAVTIVIVDDKFGTAALLVERCGGSGQRCNSAATYVEAQVWLDRLMSSPNGCELVVGPLSAEGVAAVRDYRKRGWPMHVVFYTESATQSQDARLAQQYGVMTILRRGGMAEPLERLISDLRYHPRQAPALPQDPRTARAPGPTPTARHAAPAAAAPAPAAPRPAPQAPARPGSDSRLAPPAGAADSHHGPGGRIRRSVLPPPAGAEAAKPAPLSIDVPLERQHQKRVVTCHSCHQEFVVAASGNLPVRCPHCQTVNQLS